MSHSLWQTSWHLPDDLWRYNLPAQAWKLKQSLFIVTEVIFIQDILWHEIIPAHYGKQEHKSSFVEICQLLKHLDEASMKGLPGFL